MVGTWRGPCPPRRVLPPAILEQFIKHTSEAMPSTVIEHREAASEAESGEDEARTMHVSGPGTHNFSWAALDQVMQYMWVDTRYRSFPSQPSTPSSWIFDVSPSSPSTAMPSSVVPLLPSSSSPRSSLGTGAASSSSFSSTSQSAPPYQIPSFGGGGGRCVLLHSMRSRPGGRC
jgi:hypothetical protein